LLFPFILFDVGDFDFSFFKHKFSGAASSGAESTSRSDSGELGGPVREGDIVLDIENEIGFRRGLLGVDSEPVSWSVSVDIRGRLEPTRKEEEKKIFNEIQSQTTILYSSICIASMILPLLCKL
jgi:hypothetical protein